MPSPTTPETPESRLPAAKRSGRPPRLNLSTVVARAIALADQEGLEALSMPKLSRSLGVGTMTLYGYVANKRDLLQKMTEALFAGLVVPPGDSWQERTAGYFATFHSAALEHPSLAALLSMVPINIPAIQHDVNELVEVMRGGGLSREDALRTFHSCLSYTIGYVIWEVPAGESSGMYSAQWVDLLAGTDPDRYEAVLATNADAKAIASSQQFEWGLRTLLEGVRRDSTE